MAELSRGLKAGLAAGVIYGFIMGILYFSFLEICQQTQISYIAQQLQQIIPPSSETAADVFGTDLVVFPIYYGIGALVLGVIYGAVYSSTYKLMPGRSSRQKGLVLGLGVFVIGYILDITPYGIACEPGYYSLIALALSLPSSLVFGYVLGMFYDSFGRLAKEEKEEAERRAARRR